jgi:tetratricopeptide (TPR) repeat protein
MRKQRLALAVLALLALASVSCAKLQARDNLNKGVRAFRDAKYDAAINYFQEAIKLDPSLTNAELYLATAYSQQYIPGAQSEDNQKNADLAIQTFERVLQREPDNVSAVAGLASIYQNSTQLEKAREYYIKYTQLEPQNAEAHYGVGSVNWIIVFDKANPAPPERKTELIEEGQTHLDRALSINPNYEDAMTYKNLLYREKANLTQNEEEKKQLIAQADEWFNKALDTRKKNAEKKAGPGGITLDSK